MSVPRILIPDNPVAIDKVFSEIQVALANEYSWLTHVFGKSQLLVSKRNKKEYKYPAVHYKDTKYLDMLPSKKYGNTCWFIVDDLEDILDYVPRKQSKLKSNFSIVFWVNLNEIYSGSSYRELETLKAELYNFLNHKIFYQGARVKFDKVAENFTNIYKEYSTKEIDQQYLMQPYVALRFQGNVEIVGDCTNQISEHSVTTSSGAGGTLLPEYTDEQISHGVKLAMCAHPDAGFVADEVTINNIPIPESTLPFLVNVITDIVGYATFVAEVLTLLMQVFDSIPVQRGLSWFFGDHSTKDNDVEIRNVQVASFNGSNGYVDSGIKQEGQQPIDVDLYGNLTDVVGDPIVASCGGIGSVKGIAIMWLNDDIRIYTSNGSASAFVTIFNILTAGNYIFTLSWSGNVADQAAVTFNGVINNITLSYEWVGDSGQNWRIGTFTGASSVYDGLLYKTKINELFEYILNHGQGSAISNLLDDTGTTDGTVTGATLSTFWGSTDNIEPYTDTLGCTLYKNDGDNSIMPICVNTSVIKAGFARLGYFPAGSGAIKGLTNEYYISGVDAIITEGWYTIEELIAYESANVVITQDANMVSLFKVLG